MKKFAETKKVIERAIKRKLYPQIRGKEVIGYFGQDDCLSEEQIEAILESQDKECSVMSDFLDMNDEYLWELRKEFVAGFLEDPKIQKLADWYYGHWYYEHVLFGLDFASWAEQYMYATLDFKGLYNSASPAINLIPVNEDLEPISFDCSGWEFGISGYPYEKIEELLDFLQINPREFIQGHIGDPKDRKDMNDERLSRLCNTYPDMPERKDPIISAEKLSENIDNTTSGSNILVFTCTIDLWLFSVNRPYMSGKVSIPKGTNVWLHDPWNGSGGIEQSSDREVILEKGQYKLRLDGSYGYSLNDICGGLDSSVWTGSHLIFEEGGKDENK